MSIRSINCLWIKLLVSCGFPVNNICVGGQETTIWGYRDHQIGVYRPPPIKKEIKTIKTGVNFRAINARLRRFLERLIGG